MASTDDRIASLDALGFDWKRNSTKVSAFKQRIDNLRAYKEKHGHVNVKKSEDESLYMFCVGMRQARNNPGKSHDALINEERIASLDALEFDWTIRERGRGWSKGKKTFEQRIEDLRSYKEKHGHINVKEREDKSLYQFCVKTRHARNNPGKSSKLINDDRIASLDDLGFEWNMNIDRKSFEQRIGDLRAYKEKNGHVNVKGSDDTSLYNFCRDVRYARKHPKKNKVVLTDDRILSLDTLGFDWAVKEQGANTPAPVPLLCMSSNVNAKYNKEKDAKDEDVAHELDTNDASGDIQLIGHNNDTSRPTTRSMIRPVVKKEDIVNGDIPCPDRSCNNIISIHDKGCNVLTCRNHHPTFLYFCIHCFKPCQDNYPTCGCSKRNTRETRAEAQQIRNRLSKENPEVVDSDDDNDSTEKVVPV